MLQEFQQRKQTLTIASSHHQPVRIDAGRQPDECHVLLSGPGVPRVLAVCHMRLTLQLVLLHPFTTRVD